MEYCTILGENLYHDEWQQGAQIEVNLLESLASISGMVNADDLS